MKLPRSLARPFQAGHDVDHRVRRVRQPGRQVRLQGLALYIRAAALLLPMLPYVLGEPTIRYRFPVGGLLVFLAADIVWRTAQFALKLRPSLGFSLTSYRKDS